MTYYACYMLLLHSFLSFLVPWCHAKRCPFAEGAGAARQLLAGLHRNISAQGLELMFLQVFVANLVFLPTRIGEMPKKHGDSCNYRQLGSRWFSVELRSGVWVKIQGAKINRRINVWAANRFCPDIDLSAFCQPSMWLGWPKKSMLDDVGYILCIAMGFGEGCPNGWTRRQDDKTSNEAFVLTRFIVQPPLNFL